MACAIQIRAHRLNSCTQPKFVIVAFLRHGIGQAEKWLALPSSCIGRTSHRIPYLADIRLQPSTNPRNIAGRQDKCRPGWPTIQSGAGLPARQLASDRLDFVIQSEKARCHGRDPCGWRGPARGRRRTQSRNPPTPCVPFESVGPLVSTGGVLSVHAAALPESARQGMRCSVRGRIRVDPGRFPWRHALARVATARSTSARSVGFD